MSVFRFMRSVFFLSIAIVFLFGQSACTSNSNNNGSSFSNDSIALTLLSVELQPGGLLEFHLEIDNLNLAPTTSISIGVWAHLENSPSPTDTPDEMLEIGPLEPGVTEVIITTLTSLPSGYGHLGYYQDGQLEVLFSSFWGGADTAFVIPSQVDGYNGGGAGADNT